ncbi:MAG: F0F1 ATP synthase subunit B [Chloroflexi bacterium]|nr:F0F1 ATP synthase subunit B [Chloroflexota bacterium]MBI3733534.1 F0F1 ATP synthase subunit B [Chloroflexota bacterium]
MDKLGVSLPWLIAQIINFVILLLILQRFLYKPLLNMIEKRRSEIANALANAEKVRQEAAAKQMEFEKQLEAARREAQEAIARATAQSEKVRQEIVARANEEAAQIKAKAMADADYERRQAMVELQAQVAELSLAITRKVLAGGAINEMAHRQLVQQFLSDVERA